MFKGLGTLGGRLVSWRWLLVVFVCLLALALVLMAPAGIANWLRRPLMETLTELTGHPCDSAIFAVHLPGKLAVRDLRCGELLAIDDLTARIAWWSSLKQARLVVTVRATGLVADLVRKQQQEEHHGSRTAPVEEWTLPLPRLALVIDGTQWRITLPYTKENAVLAVASVHIGAHLHGGGSGNVRWWLAGVDLSWTRGQHAVLFEQTRVAGRWSSSEGLFLDRGQLRGPLASVRLTAVKDTEIRLVSRMEARTLAAFSDYIPAIEGSLLLVGRLRGTVANPDVDLLVRLSEGSWATIREANLRARFVRTGPELSFRTARLRHAALWMAGNVQLRLDHRPTLSAAATSVVLSPARALELVGVEGVPEIVGRTFATGKITGALDLLNLQWTVSGQSDLRLVGSSDAPVVPMRWRAKGTMRSDRAEFQAQAAWLSGVRLEAQGHWTEEGHSGTGHVEASDLAVIASALDPRARAVGLRGSATVTWRWDTTSGATKLELSIGAHEIKLRHSSLRNLVCNATATNTRQWRIDSCLATAQNGGTLRISGAWDLQDQVHRNLRLEAKKFPAEFLVGVTTGLSGRTVPLSDGTLDGRLTYEGGVSGPEVSWTAALRQFRVYHEAVERLSWAFHLRQGEWQLWSKLSRRESTERLWFSARGEGSRVREAWLSGDPISLSGIGGARRQQVDGHIILQGKWQGPIGAPTGSLRASLKAVKWGDLSIGDGVFTVDFHPQEWSVQGQAFAGRLEVAGRVAVPERYRFSLTARSTGLDLVSPRNRLRVRLSGTAAASGRLAEGDLGEAELLVTELILSRDPYHVQLASPLRVRFKSDTLQIHPFELESGKSRLRVQGTLHRSGEFALELRGASDLVLLELIGPPILAANGPISVDVQITRSANAQWQSQGVLFLRQGFLEIEGIPPVSALHGFARLDGETLRDLTVEGEVGGGKFLIAGSASITQGAAFSWSLREVAGAWSDDFEATLRGTGAVHGPWEQLTVAGDVQVISGFYERNLALPDLLRWMRERLFAPPAVQKVVRTPIALDVKFHSPGNVFIDNNVAKVELWLDLWVGGTLGRPLVGGRIGVVGGEVTVQGRTFTVTGGTVEFRDPASRNPWLNLLAETRVNSPQGEYQIQVQVTGQADRPRVQFLADDPSLSVDDILSLLATGRTRAMAAQTAGFAPAGAALALLPKGEAERQLQQWLGVDRFEVAATQARDTGAVEPRVTIGKELAERLYASASTSVGVQSRQTVQVEYRWSRRVSLLGTWESATADAAGAFGGDIKFRVEFLRSPFSLLCR